MTRPRPGSQPPLGATPQRPRPTLQWSAWCLLVAYLLILGDLTLVHFRQSSSSLNLVPLRTILFDLRRFDANFVINVVGNIVAFLPVGVLAPLSWPHRVCSGARVAGVALLLSLAVEVGQFLVGHRTTDVDDLLLNTLGGWLGWLGFRWAMVGLRRRSESRTQAASAGAGRVVAARVLP